MISIEIRAWDKKTNKMLFPMEFQSGVGCTIPNEYLNHTDTDIFLRCRFETELMLYTGAKDINGVKIYEGDIIHCGIMKWEVFFSQDNGCWLGKTVNDNFANINIKYSDFKNTTVVGNIYERYSNDK